MFSDSQRHQPEFAVEDGRAWQQWRLSAPIFEHFFILGPPEIAKGAAPNVLYGYPNDGADKECQIGRFLFDEGIGLEQSKFKASNVAGVLKTPNAIVDRVVLMKTASGDPIFTYCVTVRANPLTRPATLGASCVDDLTKAVKQKKTNTCLYAFCFETAHPFFDFFFDMIELFLKAEEQALQEEQLLAMSMKDRDTEIAKRREALLEFLAGIHMPAFGEWFTFAYGNLKKLKWKMPEPSEVGKTIARVGCMPLLKWVSVDDLLMVISSLLLGRSVLVIGDEMTDIVNTVTFLPQLLYPFSWMCPIVNLLPKEKLDYLDAPVPLLVGLRRSNLPHNQDLSDRVVIDLRKKSIRFAPNTTKLIHYDQLKGQLRPIIASRSKERVTDLLSKLEDFFTDKLARKMAEYLAYGRTKSGDLGTGLDQNGFIEAFSNGAEKEFVEEFTSTQMFQAFKEQLCLFFTEANQKARLCEAPPPAAVTQQTFYFYINSKGNPHEQSQQSPDEQPDQTYDITQKIRDVAKEEFKRRRQTRG